MLEAYTAFHNYSFGNALLALEQCTRRNLQTPITDGSNGNGKSAKEKKESPFACPWRAKETPRPKPSRTKERTNSRFARFANSGPR
jgi:hypothetical protein